MYTHESKSKTNPELGAIDCFYLSQTNPCNVYYHRSSRDQQIHLNRIKIFMHMNQN